MSHTAAIKAITIVSITALRSAIEELRQQGTNILLTENAKPRAFYENQVGMGRADFVIGLPDCPYDIGLYKKEDGGYEARTDFFSGHIERVLGAPASAPETKDQARMGKLFQMYGVHATMEEARKKGHMVSRRQKEDGTVLLELTGPSL